MGRNYSIAYLINFSSLYFHYCNILIDELLLKRFLCIETQIPLSSSSLEWFIILDKKKNG